jgi:peptidylprolyl isomerase
LLNNLLKGHGMKNLFAVLFMVATLNYANAAEPAGAENILVLELATGKVEIELYPQKAPHHVERIKELARSGFYNGVPFHRVIKGFMAQTGDPTGTGSGKSDLPDLEAEFNDMPHTEGVVSMARAMDPNSANSQFFIMLAAAPHLDGQYTAFGKVVNGMEYVHNIKKGTGSNGAVENPDKIVTMKILQDAQQ